MDTTEEWRDIAGYEGIYMVSDMGRVLSVKRTRTCGKKYRIKERVLCARKNPVSGYPVVCLHNAPLPPKSYNVHTLVATTFLGPCPPGMECCHNNGKPEDARLQNLRWDTHMSNIEDTKRQGNTTFGEKNPCARFKESEVRTMLQMLASGKTQKQVREHFGHRITKGHMSLIANRKLWGHIVI